MTSSVVYSALCAAIFSELPALSIRFLAFSTQVVDLSGHVSDPLTLLLEVQVGGGTHIGLGLRHARAGCEFLLDRWLYWSRISKRACRLVR